MHIAIFDYQTVRTNAIGNCNWLIIDGLKDEHDFTVFSLNFDNPNTYRARFVRVPVPARPLFLLFIAYHIVAPLLLWNRRRQGQQFDHLLTIESNLVMRGSIVYAHFCHRAYLEQHWQATRPPGLRGWARWLDHKLHALLEPLALRRARKIIVPSKGLQRELEQLYPNAAAGKIQVIPNPVNAGRMRRPDDFDRATERARLGFKDDDLVMVFVAAGHFERKGLPLLLDAMRQANDARVKLVVVGGLPGVIHTYEERARALGLADQAHFTGFQQDIRPYLWLSDIFAFPSSYETFSLVAFEAAAAGLPLLISKIHGVEEMLVDGENGWLIQRQADVIAECIRYALAHPDELQAMGQHAAASVGDYNEQSFVDNWRAFLRTLEAESP